jgi:hypothetical protein
VKSRSITVIDFAKAADLGAHGHGD